MVLSSQNKGKYLMKSWHEDRAKALQDRSQFSDDYLEWLEILPDEGVVSQENPEVFKVDNVPYDPNTPKKKIDIRGIIHGR